LSTEKTKKYLDYDGLVEVIDQSKEKFAYKKHKHASSDITDLVLAYNKLPSLDSVID
jgi:hypothetical protein